MKDTAIIVTTFLRDKLLFRCVKSIRKYYPNTPIFIGDNGHHTEEKRKFAKSVKNCTYIELPFDCGVGGTRNEAIKRIPKKYKYLMIVENDIVFTEGTQLEKLYQVLESDPTIGLAGGMLLTGDGKEQHYEGKHWIDGDTKYTRKIKDPEWHETQGGIKFHFADLILNVFMMRRAVWDGGAKECPPAIQWDPQFKTALEHADFFISLKYYLKGKKPVLRRKCWKVAYVPEVWMYHKHDDGGVKNYTDFRSRPVGFRLFGRKWGIRYSDSEYNTQNPIDFTTYGDYDLKPQDEVLETAVKIFDNLGIKWWLMSGSALGAYRENDYLGSEDDIDIGVAPENIDNWDDILKVFKTAGFKVYKEWVWEDKKIELTFTKEVNNQVIKIDIFFHYVLNEDFYWYAAFGPDSQGRWGEYMQCVPRRFPYKFYKHLDSVVFRGIRCFLPFPTEEYLAYQYGKDWRTPNKDYKYWKDNQAIDLNLFEKKKTVLVCDSWDCFSVAHLDVLERAAMYGTNLTVGILTDEAVRQAGKETFFPFGERKRIIEALAIVNDVVKQDSIHIARLLQKTGFKPNYLIEIEENDCTCNREFADIINVKIETFPPIEKKADPETLATLKRKQRAGVNTIAVGIKTLFRERNFYRVLDAIKENFPFPYRLYIADDGVTSTPEKKKLYEELSREGHVIIKLPFNCGLSQGRNSIINEVKEDFVLIMDDDIEIYDGEAIKKMKTVLTSDPYIGLTAGSIVTESGVYFGNENYSRGLKFVRDGSLLRREPSVKDWKKVKDVSFLYADQVANFFLAKRDVFKDIKWDDRIKIQWEHMDFFLRLQETKWKATVCPEAQAIHLNPDYDEGYDRLRRTNCFALFGNKHGISRVLERW